MNDPETVELLQQIAELKGIVSELKSQYEADRQARRDDSAAIWQAIAATNTNVSNLSTAVATGKGGVRVLAWIGTFILGVGMLATAIYNVFH